MMEAVLQHRKQSRGHRKGLWADAWRGALAGAAGVWVMDQVGNYLLDQQNPQARRQEKKAQIEGKSTPELAAERLSSALGKDVTYNQVHYGLGILPGALFGTLVPRTGKVGGGRGLLYGLFLFLFQDELMAPVLKLASGPTRYPWQTHVRGLLSHLALGVVTYQAFKVLRWI